MQKAKVVIQPAKVVSHRILGRRPVKMSQNGPDGAAEGAIPFGEKLGRARAGQPNQSAPQVGGRQAQRLQVRPGFFGGLRLTLGFGVQHFDMCIWRHYF